MVQHINILLIFASTKGNKNNIMKTKIFENEKTKSTIWNVDGVIYFREAGAKLNSFDLNNEADYKEFITDVIIGCGYADGFVETIREDKIGGCTFESASKFFENVIRPILK